MVNLNIFTDWKNLILTRAGQLELISFKGLYGVSQLSRNVTGSHQVY